MELRAGIPQVSDVQQLSANGLLDQHARFNDDFLHRHSESMKAYGARWIDNPLKHWSRQWEYPFVAQRLISFGKTLDGRSMQILDAGSGVTYFDYFIADALPHASIICCDNDSSYHGQFKAINAATPGSRVSFVEASLQSMPFQQAHVDAICCLSVLEHTDRYEQILDEFARVLRTGGQLVLTFDLSLDGKFELSFEQATAVLRAITKRFVIQDEMDPLAELNRMKDGAGLLSTDYIRQTDPQLLPWKHPLLKGMHDLFKGKGWTGGFRSKSLFCIEARRE